jgi:hypothetical protein
MLARTRPRRSAPWLGLSLLVVGTAPTPTLACDAHSVYVQPQTTPDSHRVNVGVAEQFTNFGTVAFDGEVIPSEGEVLNSSITQVFAGYGFTDWIGVQLNLPIIARDYRRLENGRLTSGSVSGVGDMTLIGIGTPFDRETPAGRLTVSLLGGLEFPTGDPALLAEELDAPQTNGASASRVRPKHDVDPSPGEPPPSPNGRRTVSAIRGHDLALGSGSVDGVVGGQLTWRRGRAFGFGLLQYAVRSEGSFEYTFANELTWTGGPGYDVLSRDTWSLGLQAVLSGDTKGNDTQAGAKLDDTARTRLYVGPGLLFNWTGGLAAQLNVDLPVIRHETSLQVVPDVRVRAGLIWRF